MTKKHKITHTSGSDEYSRKGKEPYTDPDKRYTYKVYEGFIGGHPVIIREEKKGSWARKLKGAHVTPVQRARKVYALKGRRRWCPANFPESYMPLKKIKKK